MSEAKRVTATLSVEYRVQHPSEDRIDLMTESRRLIGSVYQLGGLPGEGMANAKFLALAWNSHDDLLDALKLANAKLQEHHNSSHPAPLDFLGGNCPVCSVALFTVIDTAIKNAEARS